MFIIEEIQVFENRDPINILHLSSSKVPTCNSVFVWQILWKLYRNIQSPDKVQIKVA